MTASADAVRTFLTDMPSRSLPRVASRIWLGSVSSMNCTSGSMSSANRTGLCMISLLSFQFHGVAPESYRVAGSSAASLLAPKRARTSARRVFGQELFYGFLRRRLVLGLFPEFDERG